ncbi:SCP2 sterol-binding domain-containing protein [Brevibacillus choshinensis]|uniref:SCP2 sterol-binding domain-containing protein n=1 Tax=Brevibacillus choshinensis TaxID=54911 RepID=A0ABX7FIB4_BRECH|nr:SCP2 sterol-binding domain-containing protein [Brevibacillus choshinensis]QRG65513.1 SCP2 sterol-binding domain-containing protein [Brevibacillus choshinensis]
MTVEQTLRALSEKINANPHAIQGFHAIYHFLLSGDDGGQYQVTFAGNHATYSKGTPDEAKCTLELSDANFIKLVEGTLNPTAAFMLGKLKINGDIGHSLKLQTILNAYQS